MKNEKFKIIYGIHKKMFCENNHMFVIDNLLYLLLPRKQKQNYMKQQTYEYNISRTRCINAKIRRLHKFICKKKTVKKKILALTWS